MLAFAIEGITSLSTKPIRMITFMGIAAFFVSIGFLIWAVVDFFRGNTITGWASMMVSLWFIGGLLLLSVGIVGEYVGKIYLESKHRPRYIIESRTPDRIREREKGRSRKQEMPGENLRRSRAEARELQTSKRREAVQKPEQSEMYFRKISPRTTDLYSDASIFPRKTQAASQICFSKPILLVVTSDIKTSYISFAIIFITL